MVEFLRKFDNRGIKIAGVNSIRITKSKKLLKFNMALVVRGDDDIFKLTACARIVNQYSSFKLTACARIVNQ